MHAMSQSVENSWSKCLISSQRQRETAEGIALFIQQIREANDADDKEKKLKLDSDSGDLNETDKTTQTAYFETSRQEHEHIFPTELISSSINKLSADWGSRDIPKSDEIISQHSVHDQNIAVLKYLFPFYDITILKVLSQSCRNNVLETVLSISSHIMEERNHMPSVSGATPHLPLTLSTFNKEKCCDSLFCPNNCHIELRKKANSVITPQFSATLKQYSTPYDINSPLAKKTYEFSYDKQKGPKIPYCASCNRYGLSGDKFCPLCGVQF